jgi:DNA-binding SARP family transcriptional activator
MRGELRLQLLGDWLLTLTDPAPTPSSASEQDGSPVPAPNGLPVRAADHPTDPPPSYGAPGNHSSRLTAPTNGSATSAHDGSPAGRSDQVLAEGYDGPLTVGDGRSAVTYRDGSPMTYPDRSFEQSTHESAPDLSHAHSAAGQQASQRLTASFARQARDGSAATVRQIDLPAGPKNLISLLALHGRCARIHAAATLWPDCTDDVAAARLRAVLWRLRHRHVGVPPLLEIGDSSLALTDEVDVDVDRFRDGAELLIRDPDNCSAEAEEAADAVLHSAELLPGWYDDWVLAARERLQYLRLGALDALAARRRRQHRTHETLEAARAAISIEPLHESAHRTVVRTHLDNGDIVEAIKHYQRFEAMLDRELGLPPSALFLEMVSPYLALSSHKSAHPR